LHPALHRGVGFRSKLEVGIVFILSTSEWEFITDNNKLLNKK